MSDGTRAGTTFRPGGEAPDPEPVLVQLVLRTFRLNGMFLQVAERLARPAGLTAAWWQVLGAVLRQPLPVAGVAREMGLTRQSVQRIADLLVRDGLAEYQPNPAHARAKLLSPTPQGRHAITLLSADTVAWARAVADIVGEEDLRQALAVIDRLVVAVTDLDPGAG